MPVDLACCPLLADLERFVLGQTTAGETDQLEGHVAHCARCAETIARLSTEDPLEGAVRAASVAIEDSDRVLVADLIGKLKRLRPMIRPVPTSTVTSQSARELLSPPEGPGEIGRLGSYRILAVLGAGGMGIVYRAEQVRPRRQVALKLSLASAHSGRQARSRLEPEMIAGLQHPNIVPVYEVGEHQGHPYFTMELMEGGSLAGKLAVAPLTARAAAELVRTLAGAVHFAHERGFIHRDLKPANVLLSFSRKDRGPGGLGGAIPKISDFGLAKHILGEGDTEEPACRTESGAILGTPGYMAPEQAGGRSQGIGRAADVYSLGAILYECLTGRPPFNAATVLETLNQVRSQEPVSPARLQPDVPRDLETICLKCLEKDPSRRYGSAADLAEDLGRFLRGETILARPIGWPERLWRWYRRNPVIAGLGLAAALFLIVGTLVSAYFALEENARAREARDNAETAKRARKDAQRESALLALERGRHLAEQGEGGRGLLWLARSLELATETEDRELARAIRMNLASVAGRLHTLRQVLPAGSSHMTHCLFTPDGKKVWVRSYGKNEVRLWDAASGQPGPELRLDQPAGHALALSSDGKVLFTGGELQSRLWDTATNRPREPPLQHPTGARNVRCAAFRPDGRMLATGHNGGSICLWDAATGGLRAAWQGHPHEVLGVAFSPDGKTLATGNYTEATLRLWNADTGQPLGKPIPQGGQVFALTWNPDGQTILVGNAMGTAQFWDGATGLRRGLPLAHRSTVFSATFSRDGQIIATGSSDRTARLWETGTRQPVGNLLPHPGTVCSLDLRPDGNVLATASEDGPVRIWQLAPRIVLPHRSWVYSATFSPDGRTAFTGCADHTVQRWEVSTGKKGDPCTVPDGVRAVAVHPDGQAFFAGCNYGQVWRRELSPSNTGRVLCSHPHEILALTVSPNGCTVATGGTDGTARLWDAATGQSRSGPLRHDGEVTAVAFSRDGHTVLTASKDKTARLWDVATGRPQGTPLPHPDEVVAVAFHPDGSRMFTAGRDSGIHIWDAATQQPIGKPLALEHSVTSMALSPDGRTLLVGSNLGMAQLFDLATALPLGTSFSHGQAVRAVAFSPDGRTALTTSQDTTARLWEVPPPVEGDLERIGLWAQVISGLELKADRMVSILDAPTWQQRRQRLQALGGAPIGFPSFIP
jgi:WD40 repeat protein